MEKKNNTTEIEIEREAKGLLRYGIVINVHCTHAERERASERMPENAKDKYFRRVSCAPLKRMTVA